MTVHRVTIDEAAWTYDNELGPTWRVLLHTPAGEWVQLDDDGGVSYVKSAGDLRRFIYDWVADAALEGVTDSPTADEVDVYREMAEFVDEHSVEVQR